jgi:hypothetical protein
LLLVVAILSLAKAETGSLWSMQKFGGEKFVDLTHEFAPGIPLSQAGGWFGVPGTVVCDSALSGSGVTNPSLFVRVRDVKCHVSKTLEFRLNA